MTPEREDAEREVLHRVVLRSEQLRTTLLVVVAVVGMTLVLIVPQLLRGRVHAFFRGGQGLWVVQACFASLLLYASALRVWISRRHTVPWGLQILTTCLEALIPTAFLWAMGGFLGPATSLFLPPPMLYFLFIIVSTLRLDARLCVLSGALSGASYLAVALWSLEQPDSAALPLLLASPYQHIGRAALLVIGGGLAGIVSAQIRRQVSEGVALLRELQTISGDAGLAFPNTRSPDAPMTENTVLFALYRMGYHGRATGHGFRATFSTILHEQGFNPDWIERQLAHGDSSKVRAAYHRSQYLADRRKMMQAWADYLDGIAAGAKVTPIRRAKGAR